MKTKPRTAHHRKAADFKALSKLLGERVHAMRLERGWTMNDAAEQIWVEPAQIMRLERGTANPTLGVLTSIARAFEITVPDLLAPGDDEA